MQYAGPSVVSQGVSSGADLQYSCKGVNCPRVNNAGVGQAVRDIVERLEYHLQQGQQHCVHATEQLAAHGTSYAMSSQTLAGVHNIPALTITLPPN
jgi:hypothetical protein